jgi:type VI secretion system secreted protein VgrG
MSTRPSAFVDHRHHKLKISDLDATLDVLAFEGHECLSQPFRYEVEFTCTQKDIAADQVLGQIARFSLHAAALGPKPVVLQGMIVPPVLPLRTFHGVITGFQRLSDSVDETRYAVTLQPRLALLERGRQWRIYQQQSVPDIVESILRSRHDFRGQDFLFKLAREYPRRDQVMQYGESDLAFINRLLAEVGIWYRITSDERLRIDVVEFHDHQRHYQYDVQLPLRPRSGFNSSQQDCVWQLQTEHRVVEREVNVRAYHHRHAGVHLDGKLDPSRGASRYYGEAYHYGEPYTELGGALDLDTDLLCESGYFYARLNHERYLNEQTRLSGETSSAALALAEVLNISGGAPQAFEPGAVITRLTTRAARDRCFEASFEALPFSETLCFRPPLLPRPRIAGTLPARVTSPERNDPYGHIDLEGRYKVNFLFDRDEWQPGRESMWLRLARPYAGDTQGLHLPLLAGTEVAVAFEQGDPDRPYIAHALHDSRHPDHVTLGKRDYSRNVLRTPANNKLRMEDRRGQEHIKLSTEYGGKSQLNLGHLVDAQKHKRGEGFELRTDDWGVIRGGKGVFISADGQAKAKGEQLDMQAAIDQLESALSLARSLAQAARGGKATAGDTDSQVRLHRALAGLAQPGLLLHSPAGIGVVSPEAVCVASAAESVGVIAAHNVDLGAGRDITATAEGAISVFAQNADMQLKAAQGKVELHAQNNSLHALAKTDIKLESLAGRVEITAPEELVFNCAGAYIRLKGGEIELGAPGNIYLKAANVQKVGSASLSTAGTQVPSGYSGSYALESEAQAPLPFARYRVTTPQGEVFNGVTDKDGRTLNVHTQVPGALKVEFTGAEKWIGFTAPAGFDYQGLKCTATMDDGTVLNGEFDSEGKVIFDSFAADTCVKFTPEDLDHYEELPSGAQRLLRELEE